ncbi:hypothetical protein HALO59_130043 [Halomonas sp. 59]|nr:hypothetical protein HALO59_130043 [Halomonas sp. 59]CAD5255824.1 hypothetical protein HALO113_140045 [Halomonas sp. 113]CAD5262516.1 hypothetical protein HALOI3_180043 [Halomonas sp. I3]CAD5293215.1 hypothetical protein HALO156_60001 [Halomonas sp. 156]VXB17714.1 hypothetical protein HALO98_150045 [Halomonas titanicae]
MDERPTFGVQFTLVVCLFKYALAIDILNQTLLNGVVFFPWRRLVMPWDF